MFACMRPLPYTLAACITRAGGYACMLHIHHPLAARRMHATHKPMYGLDATHTQIDGTLISAGGRPARGR